MFKIGLNTQYTWPVTVVFAADGGKGEKHRFDVTFKRFPQSELDSMQAKLTAGTITEQELVRTLLLDWKGVQDADGSDLPFSEAALDKLLDVFPVPTFIIRAWLDSLRVGREKN